MKREEFINSNYIQLPGWDVCVLASYGLVINHFSDGNKTVSNIFEDYVWANPDLRSQIEELAISADLMDLQDAQTNKTISCHFHSYCQNHSNIRGYEFIEILHNNDSLAGSQFCEIKEVKAQLINFTVNEKNEIRQKLIDNPNLLAIVLYQSAPGYLHSVVVGYDEETNQLFKRDPDCNDVLYEDVFAINEISEVMIFAEPDFQN